MKSLFKLLIYFIIGLLIYNGCSSKSDTNNEKKSENKQT